MSNLVADLANLISIRAALRSALADRTFVSNAQRTPLDKTAREVERAILTIATSERFLQAVAEVADEKLATEKMVKALKEITPELTEEDLAEEELEQKTLEELDNTLKSVVKVKAEPIESDIDYQARLAAAKAATPPNKRIKVKKSHD
jgi:cell division protein FtsX